MAVDFFFMTKSPRKNVPDGGKVSYLFKHLKSFPTTVSSCSWLARLSGHKDINYITTPQMLYPAVKAGRRGLLSCYGKVN